MRVPSLTARPSSRLAARAAVSAPRSRAAGAPISGTRATALPTEPARAPSQLRAGRGDELDLADEDVDLDDLDADELAGLEAELAALEGGGGDGPPPAPPARAAVPPPPPAEADDEEEAADEEDAPAPAPVVAAPVRAAAPAPVAASDQAAGDTASDADADDLLLAMDDLDDVDAAAEAEFVAEAVAAGGGSLARGLLALDPSIEGEPLKFLDLCEAYWTALKTQAPKRGLAVLKSHNRKLGAVPTFDVAVCGGTLGLMLATALQARGLRVCVIERRVVQGRAQEWNAADEEVRVLTEMGLLTQAQVDAAVVTRCGPMRVAFAGGDPLYLGGALDRGVCPRTLLASLRSRFEADGGVIMERTAFRSADIFTDGVAIKVKRDAGADAADLSDASRPLAVAAAAVGGGPSTASEPASGSEEDELEDAEGDEPASKTRPDAAARAAARTAARAARARRPARPDEVTARLVVDAMGNWSPIVKAARPPSKPDGVCLVVGTCASGFPEDLNAGGGDFLRSVDDASPTDDCAWLWEAFPAEGEPTTRTTYMFAYMDADKRRPTLTAALDRYFSQLPAVEPGTRLSELSIKRVMCGVLPSYSPAPLRPPADRVVQAGDASGGASPLSFGGFGAMLRHLPRLAAGIDDALAAGDVSQAALSRLQPYQPSLSANALFARAMRAGVGSILPPKGSPAKPRPGASLPGDHINRLLSAHFRVLAGLGVGAVGAVVRERTRPALLGASMVGMALIAPVTILRTLPTLGAGPLLAWFGHYTALVLYSVLRLLTYPLRSLVSGPIAGLAPLDAVASRPGPAARAEREARLSAAGAPGWARRAAVALRRGLEALDVGSGHDGSTEGVVMLPEPAKRRSPRKKA